MRQTEIEDAEWANPANWYGGFLNLYYSKRDTRGFVPKRNPAMGTTINWAKPEGAWFVVGVIVFIIVVASIS
jgi:uncharacterized membrane protein